MMPLLDGMAAAASASAWIPLLEPLPLAHRCWWLLIVPIAVGVSLAWKAVRLESVERWQRPVAIMSGQIVLAVAGIALGLFLLVQIVLPLLPAE
jgi:hypothetical protein